MEQLQVEVAVITILCREFDLAPEQIVRSMSLTEDLKADSLALTNLALEIEDHFKIQIPDEDFKTVRTVDDVIRCIERFIESKENGTSAV